MVFILRYGSRMSIRSKFGVVFGALICAAIALFICADISAENVGRTDIPISRDVLFNELKRAEAPIDEVLSSDNSDFVWRWANTWAENPDIWGEELCALALKYAYGADELERNIVRAQVIARSVSNFDCIVRDLLLADLTKNLRGSISTEILWKTGVLLFYHYGRESHFFNDDEPASPVRHVRKIFDDIPQAMHGFLSDIISRREKIIADIEGLTRCDLLDTGLIYWHGRDGKRPDRELGELIIGRAAVGDTHADISFERDNRLMEFWRYIPTSQLKNAEYVAFALRYRDARIESLAEAGHPEAAFVVGERMERAGNLDKAIKFYLTAAEGSEAHADERARAIAEKLDKEIPIAWRERARAKFRQFLATSCPE